MNNSKSEVGQIKEEDSRNPESIDGEAQKSNNEILETQIKIDQTTEGDACMQNDDQRTDLKEENLRTEVKDNTNKDEPTMPKEAQS